MSAAEEKQPQWRVWAEMLFCANISGIYLILRMSIIMHNTKWKTQRGLFLYFVFSHSYEGGLNNKNT